MTGRYSRSAALRARAHRAIPGGAHTYSKGDDQFPARAPGFIARGKGCHVWDIDGNEFIDWGMGLRSVVLGHAYGPVLAAVREQLQKGANFTRPSPIETEFAEMLISRFPAAEMVKLAKNGSDVTTAAVRLARAFTGRDHVAVCADHAFFSVDDWFIGSTAIPAGVPESTRRLTVKFRYNDLESLEAVLRDTPGGVALVVMEAMTIDPPKSGFLESVLSLTRRYGALLLFDEIISGLRWHQRGAQSYFGVTPDLATFGKALGNGFSISALVGRRDVMERGGLHHDRERVFLLSTTHGGETHSIAAGLATLREVDRTNAVAHLWQVGEALCSGMRKAISEANVHGVALQGFPCSPALVFGGPDAALTRTLFLQETADRGILMPYIAPSLAHEPRDVEHTIAAAAEAFSVVKKAVDSGNVAEALEGPAVKPVFRPYND